MKAFAFLILLKVLGTIRTTRISDEYDITNALNDTIAEIFQTVELQCMTTLISTNSVLNFNGDTSNISWSSCYPSLEIRNVSMGSNARDIIVSYGFFDDKIQLYISEFAVDVFGEMKGTFYFWLFKSMVYFDEYTVSAVKQCNISGDTLLVNVQYKRMDINSEFHHSIKDKKQEFERSLPSILRTHLNPNKKLMNFFREIRDMKSIKTKHITSKHRYFLGHENLYHYLIPNVSLESFHLKNIVVRGLSNFYSLSSTNKCDNFTYTLLIKDIRGSMILEGVNVGRTTTSTLELHFFIGSLFISVTQGINRRLSVEGVNYSFNSTKLNTNLTQLQSDLMDSIELAIGSSLMPSVTLQRIVRISGFSCRSEMEQAIRYLLAEESIQSEEQSTKQPQNTRIPFEDKDISTKWPHGVTNNYYQFSFPNVTVIQFISGNQPHPQQIQCPILSNSEFSHRINVIPSTKLLGNNDKANSMDIHFHFDVPSVNVSIIKRNNSMENNSCEFQINKNQNIEVHPSQFQSNSTGLNEIQLEMKNKLDASLMSMTKQRVVRIIKSMTCSTFDVCSQTAQMVNEFLSTFLDKVLQKCSLRRNTT